MAKLFWVTIAPACVLALGAASCGAEDPGSDDVVATSSAAVQPRMSSTTFHGSVHLFTTGLTGAQVTTAAKNIKQVVLGSPTAATCWNGPSGTGQLAVQTEFIASEFVALGAGTAAFAALDERLDALFAQGLVVHLLIPAHNPPAGIWHGVDWNAAQWGKGGAFVPYQPCEQAAGCAYDVLFDNFLVPVVKHLVATGRSKKLAVIYTLNEFDYDPNGTDSASDWGNTSDYKLHRAQALAYTADRSLNKARVAANGTVPVGLKLTWLTRARSGWAPVNGADQLAHLLNDTMIPNGDVLGLDVYFANNTCTATGCDSSDHYRLKDFLGNLSNGQLEIAEFGRECNGANPGDDPTNRTQASDIASAVAYWKPSGLNLFAYNPNSPEGCYALVNASGAALPGAAPEASGLFAAMKKATGTSNPQPCVQTSGGGSTSATSTGSGSTSISSGSGSTSSSSSTGGCVANACGGCSTLANQPGATCGCGASYVCNGPNSTTCQGASSNACGGCASLANQPGTTCGCGGVYACSGPDATTCQGSGSGNACGGCSSLANQPGTTCSYATCKNGSYACSGPNSTSCNFTANAANGTSCAGGTCQNGACQASGGCIIVDNTDASFGKGCTSGNYWYTLSGTSVSFAQNGSALYTYTNGSTQNCYAAWGFKTIQTGTYDIWVRVAKPTAPSKPVAPASITYNIYPAGGSNKIPSNLVDQNYDKGTWKLIKQTVAITASSDMNNPVRVTLSDAWFGYGQYTMMVDATAMCSGGAVPLP